MPVGDDVTPPVPVPVHESGVAIVSEAVLDGHLAIRVAISNHRTRDEDLDLFLTTLTRLGEQVVADLVSAS